MHPDAKEGDMNVYIPSTASELEAMRQAAGIESVGRTIFCHTRVGAAARTAGHAAGAA